MLLVDACPEEPNFEAQLNKLRLGIEVATQSVIFTQLLVASTIITYLSCEAQTDISLVDFRSKTN